MNAEQFYNEVVDLIKAIGTSSSVDQERDERTVENYVRQTGNVNVPPVNVGDYTIGGNKMSNNTTEPDPKGYIAVQKDLPNANQPASTDLVNQETRPVGDVSVSDALNQTPDVSTGGAGVYKAGMTCPDCNEAVAHKCAMDKADDSDEDDKVEKADVCADCGKSKTDCGCTKKAASEDEITESPADDEAVEKAAPEVQDGPNASAVKDSKVSKVWKGAFSPFNKL
jgi:hypothetical protein